MAKTTLHLWHSMTQYYKKGTLKKYHLTKISPDINGISQKQHLTKMASQNLHYRFSEVLPTPC